MGSPVTSIVSLSQINTLQPLHVRTRGLLVVQAGSAGGPGWVVAADGRHSWIRPDGRRVTKESAAQLGQVLSAVIPDGRSRRRQPRHTSGALLDCCNTGLISVNRIHSCEGLQLFRIASVPAGMPLGRARRTGRRGWAVHRPVIMRSSTSYLSLLRMATTPATRDAAYPAYSTLLRQGSVPWSVTTP